MTLAIDGLRQRRTRPLGAVRVGLATSLVLAAGFGAMVAMMFSVQDEMAAHDRDTQMVAVSQAITAALDQAGRFALAQAEIAARQPAVGHALATGNRAELMRLTAGTYGYLRSQAVPIFGFHSADMTYLLRLHLPENFGDDLTKIRPMVLAANRGRRSQVGLEIGVAGTFVRGIAVVQDGDQFAGSVEAGLNLEPILEQVKAVTNADIAIVLSQSLAEPPPRGPNDKVPGKVFGDLILLASTDVPVFDALLRDGAAPQTCSREVTEHSFHGVSHGVLAQPLIDFSGRMIGTIVAVKSFAYQNQQKHRTRTELIAAALVASILAFVTFSILARLILAPHGTRA